jgi:hypothetical protein
MIFSSLIASFFLIRSEPAYRKEVHQNKTAKVEAGSMLDVERNSILRFTM